MKVRLVSVTPITEVDEETGKESTHSCDVEMEPESGEGPPITEKMLVKGVLDYKTCRDIILEGTGHLLVEGDEKWGAVVARVWKGSKPAEDDGFLQDIGDANDEIREEYGKDRDDRDD